MTTHFIMGFWLCLKLFKSLDFVGMMIHLMLFSFQVPIWGNFASYSWYFLIRILSWRALHRSWEFPAESHWTPRTGLHTHDAWPQGSWRPRCSLCSWPRPPGDCPPSTWAESRNPRRRWQTPANFRQCWKSSRWLDPWPRRSHRTN